MCDTYVDAVIDFWDPNQKERERNSLGVSLTLFVASSVPCILQIFCSYSFFLFPSPLPSNDGILLHWNRCEERRWQCLWSLCRDYRCRIKKKRILLWHIDAWKSKVRRCWSRLLLLRLWRNILHLTCKDIAEIHRILGELMRIDHWTQIAIIPIGVIVFNLKWSTTTTTTSACCCCSCCCSLRVCQQREVHLIICSARRLNRISLFRSA